MSLKMLSGDKADALAEREQIPKPLPELLRIVDPQEVVAGLHPWRAAENICLDMASFKLATFGGLPACPCGLLRRNGRLLQPHAFEKGVEVFCQVLGVLSDFVGGLQP